MYNFKSFNFVAIKKIKNSGNCKQTKIKIIIKPILALINLFLINLLHLNIFKLDLFIPFGKLFKNLLSVNSLNSSFINLQLHSILLFS